ncbi:MAG: hypothetical protein ACO3C1_13385, partial [Ilumatobacteraceae bacterium]
AFPATARGGHEATAVVARPPGADADGDHRGGGPPRPRSGRESGSSGRDGRDGRPHEVPAA